MTNTMPFASSPARRVILAGVSWMVLYLLALYVLKHAPQGVWYGVPLALLPAPAFAWFVWCVIGELRQADELQRRVNLEGLAFAFPAAMLLVMVLGLLELVGAQPEGVFTFQLLWSWFPPLYGIGVAIAWKRYR